MRITHRAIHRMKQLRTHAGVPETGVRLTLRRGAVLLRWGQPNGNRPDFLIVKEGLSILIDAQTYLRLADYALDYSGGRSCRFVLVPVGTRRLKAGSHGGKRNGKQK